MSFQKNKPARNPDEQLVKLKERNLAIVEEDELFIKQNIRELGYFRLSGYFPPFQTTKDIFNEGTRFKDIMRLYNFDKNLRRITSRALKCIEIQLKAKLTDVMSLVYESDWYTKENLFLEETIKQNREEFFCEDGVLKTRIVEKREKPYFILINSIQENIKRNEKTAYIKKFRVDYGDSAIVPSWMMMECVTFGDASRLFSLLKHSDEKRAISLSFGANTPDNFTSWVRGFSVLRNACAHHARIWNILHMEPSFPKKREAKFITISDESNLRQFYGIGACLLKCLFSISQDLGLEYKNEFYLLINEYEISKSAMGFPSDLEEYDIWREESI